MKAARYLTIFLFSLACCINAQAFQAYKPTPKQSPSNVSTGAVDDELEKHRSAAETYQLSGDFENARVENSLVASVALRRLASLAVREGDQKRSAEILRESIAARDNAEARTSLAWLNLQLGKLDEGIGDAKAAIELDPKSVEAKDVLGKIYFLKGDYAATLPLMERVLESKPGFDSAYTLGMTYLHLKQLDRAKLLFEEMLIAVAKKSSLHLILGRAFEETNYPLEAEREFRSAIKADPKLAGAHFYLGYTILQNGGSSRLDEAGREFDEELKISPRDPYPNFFAGVVASSMGEHKKAAGFLQLAVRLDPKLGPANLFLGQSQLELGQDVEAERNLKRAIALNDDPSKNSYQIRRAYFLLGRLLNRLGRSAEAEQYLARARELQAKLVESARDEIRKAFGEIISSKRPSPSTDPVSKSINKPVQGPKETLAVKQLKDQLRSVVAQAYHNLAVIEAQSGRVDESINKFAAAAAWRPDFPGLDRNWGIVSFQGNQFEKAIPPLSRHLKQRLDDALVRRMLGVSYYLTKNYRSAVDTLKPLESGISSDAELAYFYGISLVQLERHTEASAVFERMAENNQKSALAQFYAGQGFVLTGDLEKAVNGFRRAALIDPKMDSVHYNAGQTLIRLNRLDDAEQEFKAELKLNPLDANAKYHLAFTLIERKVRTSEAEAILRDAIYNQYDHADARYQLGKILIEKGSLDEALEQLQTAANIDPKKDYIQYQLSIAYRKASRIAEADRALKLYSDLKAGSRNERPTGMEGKKNEP